MREKSISLGAIASGVFVAGMLSSAAHAQVPTPNTYVDLPVPSLTGWNTSANAFIVDAESPEGRTYIYPNAAARDADTDRDGTGSVAFIHWDLDDGSGRAPGVQTVTDDFLFPTNNCIMASGERESEDFDGTIVPKTCSDDQGSSKRFFLEVTQADEPIDLVFNTGVQDIRYKGVKDPADDGGAALAAFREEYGIGRIYRLIQKVINDTDERVVSLKLELGTGVGDAFTPLSFADDGVAFELRPLVPREFFEGETGAPDIEVWDGERFATFSPKLFDDGLRPRFDPGFFDHQAAGMFPPQSVTEGMENSPFIDSGITLADDGTGRVGAITPNHFDMPSNQAAGVGLTGNLFGYMLSDSLAPTVIVRHDDGDPETESDALLAWWDGSNWRLGLDDNFAVVEPSQLTQWAELLVGRDIPGPDPARYESTISDDLAGLNMDAFIYLGEALLDEDLQPKLDSITLRLTAKSVSSLNLGTIIGSEEPEWIDSPAPPLHSYMAEDGVPVAINDSAITSQTDLVTIAVLANDLLDGELLLDAVTEPSDITVTLPTEPADGEAVLNSDLTVTYTANVGFAGIDEFTYQVTLYAGEDNEVVSNVARVKVTVTAPADDATPVANNDSATTFMNESVTIDVLANDTLGGNPITDYNSVTVAVKDAPLNGVAEVVAGEIVYTPGLNFTGFERFTYTVTNVDKVSNAALVTVRVDPPTDGDVPPSRSSSSSSSGCSVGNGPSPFDPLLPGLALMALGYLALRRRMLLGK